MDQGQFSSLRLAPALKIFFNLAHSSDLVVWGNSLTFQVRTNKARSPNSSDQKGGPFRNLNFISLHIFSPKKALFSSPPSKLKLHKVTLKRGLMIFKQCWNIQYGDLFFFFFLSLILYILMRQIHGALGFKFVSTFHSCNCNLNKRVFLNAIKCFIHCLYFCYSVRFMEVQENFLVIGNSNYSPNNHSIANVC